MLQGLRILPRGTKRDARRTKMAEKIVDLPVYRAVLDAIKALKHDKEEDEHGTRRKRKD